MSPVNFSKFLSKITLCAFSFSRRLCAATCYKARNKILDLFCSLIFLNYFWFDLFFEKASIGYFKAVFSSQGVAHLLIPTGRGIFPDLDSCDSFLLSSDHFYS